MTGQGPSAVSVGVHTEHLLWKRLPTSCTHRCRLTQKFHCSGSLRGHHDLWSHTDRSRTLTVCANSRAPNQRQQTDGSTHDGRPTWRSEGSLPHASTRMSLRITVGVKETKRKTFIQMGSPIRSGEGNATLGDEPVSGPWGWDGQEEGSWRDEETLPAGCTGVSRWWCCPDASNGT